MPELLGGGFHACQLPVSIRIVFIGQHADQSALRDQLAQKSEPLCLESRRNQAQARCIAARIVEAVDKTDDDRIAIDDKDDGDFTGCGLGCECRGLSARGNNHDCLIVHQIPRQSRQTAMPAVRPAVFDPNILIFDESRLFQARAQCV
ncbi:MAG TPA: hypothetical protein VL198_17005 [Pseudolabrys sp.]|nr:hypothetical protein [Pseudolabrys sp.]